MKTLAGMFFTAVNLLYTAIFGGPIDDTAWDVKMKEEGFFHWRSVRDTLVFHGGMGVVAGQTARGYAPALYDAKSIEGGTAFSLVLAGDGRDPIEWSGRVEGKRISGVVVVHGRGGRQSRYIFTGERKTS